MKAGGNTIKKTAGRVAVLVFMTAGTPLAGIEYNPVDSDSFKKLLQNKEPVHLVDIQEKNDFQLHHFSKSIETAACPVKSVQDKSRIKEIVSDLQTTDDPVVIIGSRGTRAAQRGWPACLGIEQGIASQRRAILKKSING